MIIFDIDGTLADHSHRLHFLEGEKKDWDSFYEAMDEDTVIDNIAMIMVSIYNTVGDDIILVTGRKEKYRQKTLEWMKRNELDEYFHTLYMRNDEDHRPDVEVKPELVQHLLPEITMAFEDRACMVKKWRELGITCLQVKDGDY